ncbi:unnamed protein product [Owenia fusiformis]|uniref:Uncharacterized protein n=1 Tax=Owenia fusiformis TaxID=6347 RepID=A0A8J1U869_OWEFU|nr:unnamed protein product [Owenia fusiformis]
MVSNIGINNHGADIPEYVNTVSDGANMETFNIQEKSHHQDVLPNVQHEEEEEEEEDTDKNHFVAKIQNKMSTMYMAHKKSIKYAAFVLGLLLYGAYLVYAMYWNIQGAIPLIVITAIVIFFVIYNLIKKYLGPKILKVLEKPIHFVETKWNKLRWVWYVIVAIAIIVFIGIDASRKPYKLVSVGGILAFLLLAFVGSKNAVKVNWSLVLSGMVLQFIFGLLILRWSYGLIAFQWLGDQITMFLNYADFGSKFVFGDAYLEHMFVFQVMPVITFFAAINALLYHWGVIQVGIRKFGWMMQVIMGTIPTESFIAAANVFTGPTTSLLTVSGFLAKMTISELHSAMTSGFSTVDFGLLAVYTSFGVESSHLVAASLMSAPAALAIARLLYPETEKPSIAEVKDIKFEKSPARNSIDAFASGASDSVPVVASIVVNLIAFVAMLTFINATLSWLGERVSYPDLSFQLICSYLFWPLALLMGVDLKDCLKVGELIGSKIFLSDIVAYEKLGELINNRKAGILPAMSIRSEVIATYACCGFANFSDVGIVLGSVTALAPSRKRDLASVAIRAMVAGNLACFTTACIAGMLFDS